MQWKCLVQRSHLSIVKVVINNVNIRIQDAYLGQEPVKITDCNQFLQITITMEDWEFSSFYIQYNKWNLVHNVGDEK